VITVKHRNNDAKEPGVAISRRLFYNEILCTRKTVGSCEMFCSLA
jgi:hypothetical protein